MVVASCTPQASVCIWVTGVLNLFLPPTTHRFPWTSGPSSTLAAVLSRQKSWFPPLKRWLGLWAYDWSGPFVWSSRTTALRLTSRASTRSSPVRYENEIVFKCEDSLPALILCSSGRTVVSKMSWRLISSNIPTCLKKCSFGALLCLVST